MKVNCYLCNNVLQQPGALVFTPPKDNGITVQKIHVCLTCWPKLKKEIYKLIK